MPYEPNTAFKKAKKILHASQEWGEQFTVLSITDVVALCSGIGAYERLVKTLEVELERRGKMHPKTATVTLTPEQLVVLGFDKEETT